MYNSKWTIEKLQEESLKYDSRMAFKKGSGGAYVFAGKLKILDSICKHMKRLCNIWTNEELHDEALKYSYRLEFQKLSKTKYNTAHRRGILDQICSHMPKNKKGHKKPIKWTLETLQLEALKYANRTDFRNKSGGACAMASRRGVLQEVCAHMIKKSGFSRPEKELFFIIKEHFPSAKKIKDRKVQIEGKPYIKGFEIDIFIPELNKGIEFDGIYYHSYEFMRKDHKRKKWSNEDICNYNEIKDNWFLSKGTKILHIKEQDWLKNKEKCIERCLKFLD